MPGNGPRRPGESEALLAATQATIDETRIDQRFTSDDIRAMFEDGMKGSQIVSEQCRLDRPWDVISYLEGNRRCPLRH